MRARFSRLIVAATFAALAVGAPAAEQQSAPSKQLKAKPGKVKRVEAKPGQAKRAALKRGSVRRAKVKPVSGTTIAPLRSDIDYAQRVEVLAFIDTLAEKHGFVASELQALFAKTRYNETVARLMAPAQTSQPKSWSRYRQRFVEPQRIAAGVRFAREYETDLRRAEGRYGVPAQIIVGIIGVETIYGRNAGNFRVIDSLTTLAFDYPNKERDRSPFFRAQLEDFLLFVREAKLDIFEVVGSYAGAIGIPQFMPGSYRRFAVDFDGDARIDLRANPVDAIGSVANFLREHGWVPGVIPFYRTVLPGGLPEGEVKRLVDAGSEPRFRADMLRQLGFAFDAKVPGDTLLSLIDLPNESREGEPAGVTEYVLGTKNFDALTRYNRSYFYAMAVAELGAAVADAQALR